MDLLTSAVESLKAGVEDYQQDEHGRLLAAVRSIHAGMLLLYKEALRRLSPADSNEVLLKTKLRPKRDAAGAIQFVGDGDKTVDVQQIRDRFQALTITTDWTRFNRITTVRNEIEHYYTKTNKKALEGLITDAFVLARSFIATELHEDPLQLLGEETWTAMLQVAEVHEAERKECQESLRTIEWDSEALSEGVMQLICRFCSSDLLRPSGTDSQYRDDMTLECRACGETIDAETFVPRAIKLACADQLYLSYTDGDETPYTTCPECAADAYVMDEERCAYCGITAEHTCGRCGTRIPPEEISDSTLCGYCEYIMGKDD